MDICTLHNFVYVMKIMRQRPWECCSKWQHLSLWRHNERCEVGRLTSVSSVLTDDTVMPCCRRRERLTVSSVTWAHDLWDDAGQRDCYSQDAAACRVTHSAYTCHSVGINHSSYLLLCFTIGVIVNGTVIATHTQRHLLHHSTADITPRQHSTSKQNMCNLWISQSPVPTQLHYTYLKPSWI